MIAIRNDEAGHEKSFETKEDVATFLNSEANPAIYSGWQALGIVLDATVSPEAEAQAQEAADKAAELAAAQEAEAAAKAELEAAQAAEAAAAAALKAAE